MTPKERNQHARQVQVGRVRRKIEKLKQLKMKNTANCGPNSYCGKCPKCYDLDMYLSRQTKRMPWPEQRENVDVSITSSWVSVEEYLRRNYEPGSRTITRRLQKFFFGKGVGQ